MVVYRCKNTYFFVYRALDWLDIAMKELSSSYNSIITSYALHNYVKEKSFSFSTLTGWICLILQIMIVLNILDYLTTSKYLDEGHNYSELCWFCIKIIKIVAFDHSFNFKLPRFWLYHMFCTIWQQPNTRLESIIMQNQAVQFILVIYCLSYSPCN